MLAGIRRRVVQNKAIEKDILDKAIGTEDLDKVIVNKAIEQEDLDKAIQKEDLDKVTDNKAIEKESPQSGFVVDSTLGFESGGNMASVGG